MTLRSVFLMLNILAIFAAELPAEVLNLYVAPGGDDSGPGTSQRPLASLEGARRLLRLLRRQDRWPDQGVIVWLGGGDYFLERSFTLSAEDGGTAAAPLVFRVLPGQKARLLGGRILRNLKPVSDPGVLERLDPQARGQVLEADLLEAGIRDFGRFVSRGFGRPSRPAHLELFVNGQPLVLARWPDEDFLHIAGFPEETAIDDGHGRRIGSLENGFFYEGDRPRRWRSFQDILVFGYWGWDWADTTELVAGIDLDRRWVRTAEPYATYGFRKGQRFRFLNVLEELDRPGEYYVDRQKGKAYFWPPLRSDGSRPEPSELEVLASVLESPLIQMTNVTHTAFLGPGLVLEAGRGHGVVATDCRNCVLAGLTIRNMGNWAICIDGGQRVVVRSCEIFHTGDGGVRVRAGDRKTLTPCEHLVENCHFHHLARWVRCYVPAVLLEGVGIRVAHNLIHDHPHAGIIFAGNEHVIEFNEIHHVALETGDVGAIYAGRDWTAQGTVIRHNYIHELGGVGLGSKGVYLDAQYSGTRIIGNIFYRLQRAVLLGGGRDTLIEGNLFLECEPALQLDARGLDPRETSNNRTELRRRFLEMQPDRPPYSQRYPTLAQIFKYLESGQGVPPENNHIRGNLCVGTWARIYWYARPEMFGIEDNLLYSRRDEPGFVDPEDPARAGFALRANAPAVLRGFKPIPFSQIGPQPDPFLGERTAVFQP